GENGHRSGAPSRAVENGLPVGTETRVVDGAAAIGEAVKRGGWDVAAALAEEISRADGGRDAGGDQERLGQRPCVDAPARTGVDHLAGQSGERSEVEGEVARGLEAILGLLLQAMAHDAIERGGDAQVQLAKVRRVVAQACVARLSWG